MRQPPTNYFGRAISRPYQLASSDFGTGKLNKYGTPEINWKGCKTEYADDYGFDRRNIEPNGKHTIAYILPKDSIIIRFGNEWGQYTAPQHTRYEEVSLPYALESIEYHEYRVIADGLPVQCIVEKGRVAPMFNQPGGGIQYRHEETIRLLIQNEQLERIK